MKKVTPPQLKDLFQYSEGLSDITKFHEEVKIYNSFTFFFYTTVILLFLGILHRPALIMGLSLLSFLIFQYLKNRKIAQHLRLKRHITKQVRERDTIPFKYEIINASPFEVNFYELKDNFSGDEQGLLNLKSPLKLTGHSRNMIPFSFQANAGMGHHEAKDLKLILKDPLELFKFKIHQFEDHQVEVYPLMEKIPSLDSPFDPYSFRYGEKDIPHRGDSINFHSIRSFRPGDPIKAINWRQSIKHQETIVNVFEKNINKSLTIVLNRDERLHSGRGSNSTWEYLKDFALALACQNINNGNQVQIITNDLMSPSGSGQSFINRLEFFLFELKMIRDPQAAVLFKDVIKKNHSWSSAQSSYIYLTPIVPGTLFEKNMEVILKEQKSSGNLQVVTVNPYPFLDKELRYGSDLSIKHQLATTQARLEYWKKICRNSGLPLLDITIDSKAQFSQLVFEAKERMWQI